jgi:hypothetical protein
MSVPRSFCGAQLAVDHGQRAARVLVLGLQEGAPAEVVTVHHVHGLEEVRLAPHHLLAANREAEPLADVEGDIELAQLILVVLVVEVGFPRHEERRAAEAGVVLVFEVFRVAGQRLACDAADGLEKQRPDLRVGVQLHHAAQHGYIELVVAAQVLVVAQIGRHVLAQVAADVDLCVTDVVLHRLGTTSKQRCRRTSQAVNPWLPLSHRLPSPG